MAAVPTQPEQAWNPHAPTKNELLDEQRKASRSTRNKESTNGKRPLDNIQNTGSLDEKSSLDITQKLERKLAKLNASENLLKRWFYEIVTWLVSALCMGGIVAILLYLNNRSLNKWPAGLTMYTVLSKIASAALILPTSEALGQLKWSW